MPERHSLRDLLFTTKVPIDRRRYWTIGIIGTLLKWLIDTGLVWAATGQWHSPLDFLRPFAGFEPRYPPDLPDWCQLSLILVTIPCFFISLSVSVRRAIDIGISPIWGFATGVPPLRLLAIVGLALLPSGLRKPMTRLPSDELQGNKFRSTVFAVAGATLVGLIATLVFVYGKGSYGFGLFSVTPLAMGAIAGIVHNRPVLRSALSTVGVTVAASAVCATLLIALAVDGVVCIVMALPLAIGVAAISALVARWLVACTLFSTPRTTMMVVLLPVAAFIAPDPSSPLYEVHTAIVIDAPPDQVWPHLIDFPELPAPSSLLLRSGIAYPMRARIEGQGVGAVRYCEFSTGAFVEPITGWDPPSRLSFDVSSQPMPLHETSPYGAIHPPHLETLMRSRRGEFRLIALPDGKTRLEGSTWYTLEAAPRWYWQPMTDAIVHSIHRAVLQHVATVCEAGQH